MTRDDLLRDLSRAVRECFPDRAEEIMLEVERRLKTDSEVFVSAAESHARLVMDWQKQDAIAALIDASVRKISEFGGCSANEHGNVVMEVVPGVPVRRFRCMDCGEESDRSTAGPAASPRSGSR